MYHILYKVRRTATHCHSLPHTATHCNTLQHTATHRISQVPYLPHLMNHFCSLLGSQISEHYFTYCSLQIYKILCGQSDPLRSDLPHKIMRCWFITQPAWLIHIYIHVHVSFVCVPSSFCLCMKMCVCACNRLHSCTCMYIMYVACVCV